METILDMARADDRTHLVVSVITDGNEASQRLHDKFRLHLLRHRSGGGHEI